MIVETTRDQRTADIARQALWEAIGRPERIRLNYRHKQAYLAMTSVGFNRLRQQIWSLFEPALEAM